MHSHGDHHQGCKTFIPKVLIAFLHGNPRLWAYKLTMGSHCITNLGTPTSPGLLSHDNSTLMHQYRETCSLPLTLVLLSPLGFFPMTILLPHTNAGNHTYSNSGKDFSFFFFLFMTLLFSWTVFKISSFYHTLCYYGTYHLCTQHSCITPSLVPPLLEHIWVATMSQSQAS